MAAKTFLEELRDDWLTPAQALAAGKAAKGDQAEGIILERLKGGRLRAFALSWSEQIYGLPTVTSHDEPSQIVAGLWDGLETSDFWSRDDAKFFHASYNAMQRSIVLRYFDIRFDPIEIGKLFPKPKPIADSGSVLAKVAPNPPLPSPAPKPPIDDTDKPRLGDGALNHWFAAYKIAYEPNERTLDHAWEHAKLAFPEKGITRGRVRKLMPGGKRGPRAKA